MPEQEVRRAPHPMSGWVAVVPIPVPPEPEFEGRPERERDPAVVDLGGLRVELVDLRRVFRPQSGVEAAIVLEVGPLPADADEDAVTLSIPYSGNCTVYYYADRGIRIGEFRYVRIDNVLAWEEAPWPS